ncbi:uncharacterized protein LOC126320433 [Schistocerca gregaria]|uniref:uncharacterized protein LOC126320433 n=1 Tax=Schistocerca gregaria TaxID=7010 RepID=UPI00211F22FB|nr:uncharacterized protein LOC126320433 [Schistocerca gregaria]
MRKHLELSEPKAPSSSQHLAQHAYLEQGSASEHAFDTLSDTIPTEDHSSSSFIQISSIENAAKLGLELAVNSGDLMLIFNGYLNMAELRFLQGRIASSVSFWQEFRLQFTNYFLVSSRVILRNAPAHFLEKQYLLVKRALRFLFFMPRSMVNKNLDFIDVLLLLERDFELQLQLLTDDLSVGDSSPDLHDDNTSKQQHQSEDLSQEERREHVLSKIASSIWGLLYYMKRQQHRYSEGKMMFEELRTISTDCIYKLLYLAEISRSSNPEAMINQIKNLSSNHSKRASRMLMFPPPSSSIETSGSSYLWSELEPDFKIRCEQFFLSADRQSVQTYETLMDSTNNKLTNLVYIIQLDSLIFHYVPLTGDYRIQRIGFEKSPVQPRLDNDNVILLKIHLLDQQQEFVTLSVPAYYTLNRVLDYLLDINNGNDALPIEQKPLKKRGFLGSWLHASSRNASSSSTKYSRITKVDKSPHFFSKFWQLLSFLNNTDELKSDADTQRTFTNSGQTASHRRSSTPFYKRPGFLEKQPSSIGAALKSLIILASFKARTHLESDTWIHPLSNKMHKRISDCFTKHEISHSLKAPVNLFLYLSTHVMLSGGCTTQVKLTCISREILSFLHQLLGVPCKETPIDTILCEFQQLFSPLIQILPVKHSETSLTQRLFQTSGLASLKESGSFSGQHTSPPSSSASPERTAFDANEDQTSSVQFPVILVSTRYMSSIPWELFLPCQPLVRYFLLRDAITSYIKSALHNSFSPTQPKDECAPQKTPFVFLNLYISKPFRHLLSKEVVRRNKLIQSLDNHLCASFQCCRVDYSSNDSPLFPFSTPIVLDPKMITSYKQKYKYIKFVDVSAYYPSIQSIFNLCAPSNHPVFLCSYSDLLETNYSIYQLTNNPNMLSTFIFIPNSKFKPIVHNLVSLYDPDTSNLKYPSTDGNRDYTNLTTLLNSLAVKHKTPIVCVNPFDM